MILKVSTSIKNWGGSTSIEGGLGIEFEISDDSLPEEIELELFKKRYFLDKQLIQMLRLQGIADKNFLSDSMKVLSENYKKFFENKNKTKKEEEESGNINS